MTKKRTQQNIYHIDEVNLEIDYDKLAEAIAEAQHRANAKDNALDDVGIMLKQLMTTIFGLMAMIFLVTGGYEAYSIFRGTEINSVANWITIFGCFMYSGMLIFLLRATNKVQDKAYLMSYFSAVVSLTALIVTFIKMSK